MSWWTKALFDTCSLVTLDKLLRGRPTPSKWFPKQILALEASFHPYQMDSDIAARMKKRAKICPPLSVDDCSKHPEWAGMPIEFSDFDRVIFATTVHFNHPLVTRNNQLARLVQKRGVKVGSVASILQELVVSKSLDSGEAEKMIKGLANRSDCLLRIPNPTWNDLKKHRFPD